MVSTLTTTQNDFVKRVLYTDVLVPDRISVSDEQATLLFMFCREDLLLAYYLESLKEDNELNTKFLKDFIDKRELQIPS